MECEKPFQIKFSIAMKEINELSILIWKEFCKRIYIRCKVVFFVKLEIRNGGTKNNKRYAGCRLVQKDSHSIHKLLRCGSKMHIISTRNDNQKIRVIIKNISVQTIYKICSR